MGKTKTHPMIGEQAYEEALSKKTRVQKFCEYFTETKTKKIMERNASIAYLEFQLEKSQTKNDVLMTENLQLRDENQRLQEVYSDMVRSFDVERAKLMDEQNGKNDALLTENFELHGQLHEKSKSLEELNAALLRSATESQKIEEDAAKQVALLEEKNADLLRRIEEAETLNKKIPEIEQNQKNLQTQVKKLEKQVNDWTLYARALWKPKAREALKTVSDNLALCDICHSEIEVREKRATKPQVDAVANPLTTWNFNNGSESWEMQVLHKINRQWMADYMALKAAREEIEELKESLVDLQQYKDTVLRQKREILELKDTIESHSTDLKTTGIVISQLQDLIETSQKENADLQGKISMTRRVLE